MSSHVIEHKFKITCFIILKINKLKLNQLNITFLNFLNFLNPIFFFSSINYLKNKQITKAIHKNTLITPTFVLQFTTFIINCSFKYIQTGPKLFQFITIYIYLQSLNFRTALKNLPKQKEMQHCNNCQQMVQQSKYDLHHNYCIRNIRKCTQCNEFYDKNQEEDHLQYDCKSHIKLKCQTCAKEFDNKNQLLNHMNSRQCQEQITKNRKQSCRFCQYCLLDVPNQSYDEHLSFCQSRTKSCDHCGESVMNKKFAEHIVTCEQELLNKALLMSQDQNQQTRMYKPVKSQQLPNSVPNNNGNYHTAYTTTYTTIDPITNTRQVVQKQSYNYSHPVSVTRYVYKPEDVNKVIYHQSKIIGTKQTVTKNPEPLPISRSYHQIPEQSKVQSMNSGQRSQSNNSSASYVYIPNSTYSYSNINRTFSTNDRNLPSTTIGDTRTTAFTTNSNGIQNSYSQGGYYPSYNPSQTRSQHYNMPHSNPISSSSSNQNALYNDSFDEYNFSHQNSEEQMMQAALMASMGMLDERSMSQDSKIYRQIQDQKQIEKSLKK